ncbi:MAG: hypothetical protein ACOC56_02795 [Atribacterota bacterium]
MQDILVKIISGIAIAGLSSWFAVQLSFKKFRKEKWWKKKRKRMLIY